jgi:hypothetical protein
MISPGTDLFRDRSSNLQIEKVGLPISCCVVDSLCCASPTSRTEFSVDIEGGGHGDPTFALKQEGAKLAGTYSGLAGEQKVAGTVTGKRGHRIYWTAPPCVRTQK